MTTIIGSLLLATGYQTSYRETGVGRAGADLQSGRAFSSGNNASSPDSSIASVHRERGTVISAAILLFFPSN